MSKPGRNDPCPCGSGKKYKQCCERRAAASESASPDAHAAALQTALAHYRAGRLPEAGALYRQILQADQNHPDALHYLGAIASAEGRHRDAADMIGRAIRIRPSRAMHYNLANALRRLGDLDGAVQSYREVLALDPGFADGYVNLGNVLYEQGKLDEATINYRKALLHKPDSAQAHYNLGNVLFEQGKLGEATECYRRTITLKPDFADAHYNLGNALRAQGELGEAAKNYRAALSLNSNDAKVLISLCDTLQALGNLDEAIPCYRKTLALRPDFAEAHISMGAMLKNLDRLDEALEHYRKAIALKPDFADAHNNRGNALRAQGDLGGAIVSFRRALELKPDHADAYSNLLFLYGYHGTLDSLEYLAAARGWELACVPEEERQAACRRAFKRLPLAGRRLKVGYVSGDFRQHAISYFIEQVFARHDRARVEVFAYSNHGQRDAATGRLQALAEHWITIAHLSDAQVLERVWADEIDVLVDLSGHVAYNRLGVFARRAAPVQTHYLGFFASTGLSEMDYWIGDGILTPPETGAHFSEQVWRLPRVWVCYGGKADAPHTAWRPDPDGTVWIGSFNNLGKLTAATLALWAEVLRALPEAKLLLKTRCLTDPGNRRRIMDEMAGHGVAPERIELLDATATPGWEAHMACYDRLDIALDPVGGVGGGTTTCDALWMGVPVITLMGDRMASRMTASMLDAIGHPEWGAHSEADYVAKVAALAHDLEGRKSSRASQRALMAASPLCDARGLAESLENAYFEMFERWLTKQTEQPHI